MNLKKFAVACAAVAVGQMAWAEDISVSGLDVSSGSVFFGATHFEGGAFKDLFSITGGPDPADVSVTLVTIGLGAKNIDFTSARLNGTPMTITGPVGSEVATLSLIGETGASYALAVQGIANGVGNGLTASYSGVLNVAAAVPEPETYALMLAGLGAIGFVTARRRKS